MRSTIGLLATVMLSTSVAEAKPSLAVMPLAAKRVSPEAVSAVVDILVEEIAKSGLYRVSGPADLRALLGREALKQAMGCDDVACMAEIAGSLDTDLILGGTVGKLGSEVIVTLSMLDAHSQRVVARGTARRKNDERLYEQAMLEAYELLQERLTGDADSLYVEGKKAQAEAAALAEQSDSQSTSIAARKRYRAAAASFSKFVESYRLDPRQYEVMYHLAQSLEGAGELDAAVATYEELIALRRDGELRIAGFKGVVSTRKAQVELDIRSGPTRS